MPDNITEELVAVLSCGGTFEFKPLFEILLLNLRERNAASGGEEMLRLRAYEKLQSLVSQGAVNRTVNGITKKYKRRRCAPVSFECRNESLARGLGSTRSRQGCRGEIAAATISLVE